MRDCRYPSMRLIVTRLPTLRMRQKLMSGSSIVWYTFSYCAIRFRKSAIASSVDMPA